MLTCILKKSSSTEPARTVSIKLGHPWVTGIHVCINKGPGPFSKGDNHKNAKIGWDHFKIFSRTAGPGK
jgi:hypothetical protein